MTDDEVQAFANQEVTLAYRGQTFTGKLICGFEAQVSVKAPYAIEWSTGETVTGNYAVHRAAITDAEGVESIELLNERTQVPDEIEEAVEDAQTPG